MISLAGFGPVALKIGAIESQTDNFDTKKIVGGLMGLTGFDGEDPLTTLVKAGKCDHVGTLHAPGKRQQRDSQHWR
jgi:hypothetical protein